MPTATTWDLTDRRGRRRPTVLDFRGPYVQGKRGERFLYLSWGCVDASGGIRDVPAGEADAGGRRRRPSCRSADRPGTRLVAHPRAHRRPRRTPVRGGPPAGRSPGRQRRRTRPIVRRHERDLRALPAAGRRLQRPRRGRLPTTRGRTPRRARTGWPATSCATWSTPRACSSATSTGRPTARRSTTTRSGRGTPPATPCRPPSTTPPSPAPSTPATSAPSTFEASVDRFLSADALIHTWDLARATGLDERLDPDDVHLMLEAMAADGGAVRRRDAVVGRLRPEGRGAGRRRRADAAPRLRRPHPSVGVQTDDPSSS